MQKLIDDPAAGIVGIGEYKKIFRCSQNRFLTCARFSLLAASYLKKARAATHWVFNPYRMSNTIIQKFFSAVLMVSFAVSFAAGALFPAHLHRPRQL